MIGRLRRTVQIKDLSAFKLPSRSTVFRMRLSPSMSLRFMARAGRPGQAGLLHVSFPGARRPTDAPPYFMRTRALAQRDDPFIAFADPTFDVVPQSLLAWFVGEAACDVDSGLLAVIRRAQELAGEAVTVVAGSSGGGFAALRLAPFLDHGAVVAINPQTDIFEYSAERGQHLLEGCFAGCHEHEARERWGERFSVAEAWRRAAWNANVSVHYVQNTHDQVHINRHERPFKRALDTFDVPLGVRFSRYDGDPGHTSPPLPLWLSLIEDAASTWRTRPRSAPAPTSGSEVSSAPPSQPVAISP